MISQTGARNILAEEVSAERIHTALRAATDALMGELGAGGHWTGELSSSALSTATAIVALATVDREKHRKLIAAGLHWLDAHANGDGGWGDTVRSKSNISTTALCWAAFGAAQADAANSDVIRRAVAWLDRARGDKPLAQAIEERYGKDRTFSVPILMTLALSGRLGEDGWERVIALPFELAALPHQVFGAAQLPVVSYALPALIAIGQTIHHHRPTANPVLRYIRELSTDRTLKVLTEIQPPNGGFLEATPLTSFVTMSLGSMGLAGHPVVERGVQFLCNSVSADGSWPIDTNLATWVTTLSIQALSSQSAALSPEQRLALREWLLGQQYRKEHPYTHAAPGGWAWTDLPGGVPDADDTPGALLALTHLGAIDSSTRAAGFAGIDWLLNLQNRDGGIPTFCRGWGALPFDRSSADLTAHTLRAWCAWFSQCYGERKARIQKGIQRGMQFLQKTQRPNGSWLPLWFGNEHAPDDENPLYGTAKVLIAFRELRDRGFAIPDASASSARRWMAASQNDDGGWSGVHGSPSSVEETSLAAEALAGTVEARSTARGIRWIVDRVESGTWREPAPIGFYFAKLWYYEKLYPLIFSTGALGKAAALIGLEAATASARRPDAGAACESSSTRP